MISDKMIDMISTMISTIGYKGLIKFDIIPMIGGMNNKVYRIDILNYHSFLLKIYQRNPEDKRDRLKTEFNFLKFAWNNGIRCIPEPIAQDKNMGLYQYIDGYKINHITDDYLCQVIQFFNLLNSIDKDVDDIVIDSASEACFSIGKHLELVENRIRRLEGLDEINDFVKILSEKWNYIKNDSLEEVEKLGLSINKEIDYSERCISPSDFGFHNAILVKDNDKEELKFIDFEYAGWDDPARMVCDFFCQPSVPVSLRYFDLFVKGIYKDNYKDIKLRIRILFPVYQIKWCCILLNDFLPIGKIRNRNSDIENRKIIQLKKAESMLENVKVI